MTHPETLSSAILEKLRALDSCIVSNAIERLDVRLRNEGFICDAATCRFPKLPAMAGYAATGRIRAASAPISHRCYYDRMDWWSYVDSLPAPRVLILEDADRSPGQGAFVGEIHANIGLALQCVGCVTNGAVRDLGAVESLGFQMFSGSVSPSHSYAHIIEFGEPVEIGGLKICSGDLMYGDRHGVVSIPLAIAGQIPEIAAKIHEDEMELIEFCRSPRFSLAELEEKISRAGVNCDLPWRKP